MKELKRARGVLWLIGITCFSLIYVRHIYPSFKFDSISMWLLAIGLLSILVTVLPVTKVRIGGFEAEFAHALNSLQEKVEAEEKVCCLLDREKNDENDTTVMVNTLSNKENKRYALVEDVRWQEFFNEYRKILEAPTSNLDKLVSAAILIEKMLLLVAETFELLTVRSPMNIMLKLKRKELISEEELDVFREFWKIRNEVVHGVYGILTDGQTARVLDLGWRLVRVLA